LFEDITATSHPCLCLSCARKRSVTGTDRTYWVFIARV